MKKLALLAAVAAGILATAPAMADEALAKAKNCMACHALDKKMVGPAYKTWPPNLVVKKTRKPLW